MRAAPVERYAPATLWWLWHPVKQIYRLNHLEDGHCGASSTTVKFPNQKGWANGQWQKEHVVLDTCRKPALVLHMTKEEAEWT